MPLVMSNDGSLTLTYNLCFDGFIEARGPGGWTQLLQDSTPCPSIGLLLNPGGNAQGGVRFPGIPAPGEYPGPARLAGVPLR